MSKIQVLRQQKEFKISEDKICDIQAILGSYAKYSYLFVMFFEEIGNADFSQIDFDLRNQFRGFLNQRTMYKDKLKNALVTCLDNLKLSDIKRISYLQRDILSSHSFFSGSFFLLYYPDYEIAYSYKQVSNKEEGLFWDLRNVNKSIAQQIITTIIYLTNNYPVKARTYKFRQLKCLLRFCEKRQIEDIGKITAVDKRQYRLLETAQGLSSDKGDIIDLSVYAIAMAEQRFDFTRHLWYMDALKLSDIRINGARPIKSLDFREIECSKNREYCKEYMKYLIAITDLSMASIRGAYGTVRALCSSFSEDILQLSESAMDEYIAVLDEQANKESSFNRSVSEIKAFYFYMQQKYNINRKIFKSFYYKTVYAEHNERVVEESTIQKILRQLPQENEVLALMYRVSLEAGLRINEICTLTADCLRDKEWLTVYQKKMKTEKMIPISAELYEALDAYTKANSKNGSEYLFCNQKGNAYNANTFSEKMVDFCKRNNISCKNWVYRSHDYRHHIATVMYQHDVELSVIRDFLGHKSEEMTKRYIDEVDNKIEALQTKFFKEKQHD